MNWQRARQVSCNCNFRNSFLLHWPVAGWKGFGAGCQGLSGAILHADAAPSTISSHLPQLLDQAHNAHAFVCVVTDPSPWLPHLGNLAARPLSPPLFRFPAVSVAPAPATTRCKRPCSGSEPQSQRGKKLKAAHLALNAGSASTKERRISRLVPSEAIWHAPSSAWSDAVVDRRAPALTKRASWPGPASTAEAGRIPLRPRSLSEPMPWQGEHSISLSESMCDFVDAFFFSLLFQPRRRPTCRNLVRLYCARTCWLLCVLETRPRSVV